MTEDITSNGKVRKVFRSSVKEGLNRKGGKWYLHRFGWVMDNREKPYNYSSFDKEEFDTVREMVAEGNRLEVVESPSEKTGPDGEPYYNVSKVRLLSSEDSGKQSSVDDYEEAEPSGRDENGVPFLKFLEDSFKEAKKVKITVPYSAADGTVEVELESPTDLLLFTLVKLLYEKKG